MKEIRVSKLSKTWIFDIDGTLVKHNGYLVDGHDTLLAGAAEFINKIPGDDFILLLTARTEKYKDKTILFLQEKGIRFNKIIFNMPVGERILINDKKPSGLKMSIAINTERDKFLDDNIVIDKTL